jgi:lipopolysaccharide export system protein LptA
MKEAFTGSDPGRIVADVCKWGILPLVWLLLTVSMALAQETKTLPSSPFNQFMVKEKPIQITSDKMEVSQKDGTIVFEGHVVAQQENLTMVGKKLVVLAVKDKQKPKNAKADAEPGGVIDRVDRIEVIGDVKITQGEKLATCDKAVYYRQDQKIILSGNPQVSQGKDVLNGRVITLYLLEDRSVIEGGGQNPVKATIYPDGKR